MTQIYPTLANLCTLLQPQQSATTTTSIIEQLDKRQASISDYVLRILDRFQKKRPR